MKKLLLTTILTILPIMANDIVVEVTSLLNVNGKLNIALFNSQKSFELKSNQFQGAILDINSKIVKYKFKNIPTGIYAVAIFHDENENENLDTNFLGIPSEGYGFSNNIRPTFRGANFEESKFILNSNKNIKIQVGY